MSTVHRSFRQNKGVVYNVNAKTKVAHKIDSDDGNGDTGEYNVLLRQYWCRICESRCHLRRSGLADRKKACSIYKAVHTYFGARINEKTHV